MAALFSFAQTACLQSKRSVLANGHADCFCDRSEAFASTAGSQRFSSASAFLEHTGIEARSAPHFLNRKPVNFRDRFGKVENVAVEEVETVEGVGTILWDSEDEWIPAQAYCLA